MQVEKVEDSWMGDSNQDFEMKLFRKKNKRTIEEQNLHNKKIWKKEQESEEKLANPDFPKRGFNLDDEFEKEKKVWEFTILTLKK